MVESISPANNCAVSYSYEKAAVRNLLHRPLGRLAGARTLYTRLCCSFRRGSVSVFAEILNGAVAGALNGNGEFFRVYKKVSAASLSLGATPLISNFLHRQIQYGPMF